MVASMTSSALFHAPSVKNAITRARQSVSLRSVRFYLGLGKASGRSHVLELPLTYLPLTLTSHPTYLEAEIEPNAATLLQAPDPHAVTAPSVTLGTLGPACFELQVST